MLIIFLACLGILFVHFWGRAVFSHPYPHGTLPAPGALPVVGHAVVVLRNYGRILEYFLESTRAFARQSWCLSLPFMPVYIVTHNPANIEYVLKSNFDNYVKGPFFSNRFIGLLGQGIFNVDGEKWRSQRKTATHIFNVRSFKLYVEHSFKQHMQQVHGILTTKCKTKAEFDLQELFFKFTLDTFTHIGFGVDLGSLLSDGPPAFATAFDRAQATINFRFFNPFWKFTEAVTPAGWQFRQDIRTVRAFARHVLTHKREHPTGSDAESSDRKDLLSLFMEMQDESGKPLTDEVLSDYVLNFIIAGRDTTAQALSWTFYMLALHPNVTQKILEEVKNVLGEDPNRDICYDGIRQLRYTKAVLLETLRLYPSVPKEHKSSVVKDKLPDGTEVPAAAAVIYIPWVLGRLEACWGADAEKFRPERWIESETLPSPFVYPVFHAGPRVCLGRNLAELEGVFVIVSILRSFEVKVVDASTVTYANSVTLPMKNGLKVTVSPRV